MKLIIWRICGLLLAVALTIVAAAVPDEAVLPEAGPIILPAEVRISDADDIQIKQTFARTLIEAIDEMGLPLAETDTLSLPESTRLMPGEVYQVAIERKGKVKLNWGGYAIGTSSELFSMGDLLARSGFADPADDSDDILLQNKHESASAENGEITYVNIEKKQREETEAIPFSTVTLDDPTQYVGKSSVQNEGEAGQRTLVYEETYENGIFTKSELVDTIIIKEPVQKVILAGSKKKPKIPAVSKKPKSSVVKAEFAKIKDKIKRNGNAHYKNFKDNGDGSITVDGTSYSYIQKDKRVITMYDGLECCLQDGCHSPAINHNTASGISAQRGLVAAYGYRVNGKFAGTALPLGTTLFIEGYGLAVVADVHGAHWNPSLLDACFDAGEIRSGKVTWGKRTKAVYIISLP